MEAVLRSHVEHLQEELAQRQGATRSGSAREDQLRRRVEELLGALDRLAGNSEARQAQADELIGDLKRANATLAEALEGARRKQRARAKRIEARAREQVAAAPSPVAKESSRPSVKSSIPVPSKVSNAKSK